MEDVAVTNPVPAVEEQEIISVATTGPKPVEPTATNNSGEGEDSKASCKWSLPHNQQVHNLKENWKRALHCHQVKSTLWDHEVEVSSWFEAVVAQLQDDHCLESKEFEIDESLGVITGFTHIGTMLTSLDLAILMGDLKMVQKILEKNSNPKKLNHVWKVNPLIQGSKKTSFECTPLHLAVLGGDSHIVDVLLEKGADVNVQNINYETPLDYACKMKSVDMLLKLLEKDGKKGKHPLHVAVRHGDIDFLKKLPSLKANVLDHKKRTPLHYLAKGPSFLIDDSNIKNTLNYLNEDGTLDMKALDDRNFSAFYMAVLNCNTKLVIALLDSFKNQIRLNEVCDKDRGPPIQIAYEGEDIIFGNIKRALMECDTVKGYMETLYRDRQVYVDAANAILVGSALIASVTFGSWLQPPLNYTSYSGEGYSSSVPVPSHSDINYVDVEHNIALRAFWIFNALSFYFAIGSVVCGARSVLPRSHLFIKKIVERLRTNLLVTAILLACSVLFVILAFAIAGTIVLTPLLKYQWYMIVPTLVGGIVCIISLVFLAKSIVEIYFQGGFRRQLFYKFNQLFDYLKQ